MQNDSRLFKISDRSFNLLICKPARKRFSWIKMEREAIPTTDMAIDGSDLSTFAAYYAASNILADVNGDKVVNT
jgi:hypothetical protein